ncbi:hypothetical protein [Streptomyces sp. A012304]|nr:hypothetical protein [Streptomyces sp. A012304]
MRERRSRRCRLVASPATAGQPRRPSSETVTTGEVIAVTGGGTDTR